MSKIYFQSKGFPEYRFLSNFHIAPIHHNGFLFQTTEHFYQAQKSVIPEEFKRIAEAESPKEAKKLGQLVQIPENWNSVRDLVMLKALRLKFSQHDDLFNKLIATEDAELIEFAPWGDVYWGVDKNYQGQNKLGQLLMKVREEMRVQYKDFT
jgi:ribA/ribD-fused uncharacterized protein